MCNPPRRRFLGRLALGGLQLTPLAAILAGCSKGRWPEGMVEIDWGRDTCARCHMVIADHRFAAQIRGGPEQTAFKFDDPGCLVFWLRDQADRHPWMADAASRIWLADFDSPSREAMNWLNPKNARFVTRTSPMRYNYAAVATPQTGSLDFEGMRQQVLALGS